MGRRTKGEGSIYQRESDGRWVGVVDLGWVGGKRLRKTVTAATLRELRPKFKALKAQIEQGVVPDDATVDQWMTHWLDNVAEKKVRASTMRTYRGYTDTWIRTHLGRRRLDRLKPEHIEAMLSEMEAAGKSDATRRQVFAILRRALEVAWRQGRVPMNAAARVETVPPVGTGSHGSLTLAEAKKVLAIVAEREPVERARWMLALLAGLRQGEALGLRWERVDFEEGLIFIEVAAQRVAGKGILLVEPKSASSRRAIPMVGPVRLALESIEQREGFLFGGDSPQDPRRDWQAWRDLLAEAGVAPRPLHAARATTASLLEAAGISQTVIKEIMGHSQVMVTQRHYLHADVTQHRAALGTLGDFVGLSGSD